MAVSNNLKEIREARGLNQEVLADATGYCRKREHPKVCVNLQTDVR